MSRESRGADRSINVSSVLLSNSFVEKAYVTLATNGCGHLRGGAKTKDKRTLREKGELTVSIS